MKIKNVFRSLALALVSTQATAGVQNFEPVTEAMLADPSPDDWLMFSRTYDAQRFSPLDEINRENVDTLDLAWSRELGPGSTETIPIVYDGVMYLVQPGASVLAVDATTGDELWTYRRRIPEEAVEFVGREIGRAHV